MKKFRSCLIALILLVVSVVFFACNDNGAGQSKIKVTKVEVFDSNNELVVDTEDEPISLEFFEGESKDFTYKMYPSDATDKSVTVSDIDSRVASCDVQDGVITITASNDVYTDNKETWLSVKTNDGSNLNVTIKIIVNKASQDDKMTVVENLKLNYVELDDAYNISWNPVDKSGVKGYIVNINGQDQPITSNVQMKMTRFGEALTVKVRAVGVVEGLNLVDNNGQYIYSDAINFKILEAPKNLAHENTNITWSLVDDVRNGYELYISHGAQLWNVPVGNSFTGYSEEFADAGEYKIRMRAIGDESQNIYNSVFTNNITFKRLETPRLSFKSSVAGWDSVEYVSYYSLMESFESNTPTEHRLTTNAYYPNYKTYQSGTYSYKVKAVGDGITALSSEYSNEYEMTKLAPVTNVTVENGSRLVWKQHLLAHSYSLTINGFTYWNEAQTNEYKFDNEKDSDDIIIAGTYALSIIADGDGTTTFSSDPTEKVYVTKLARPEISGIENNVLKWNKVTYANEYEVFLDNKSVGQNFTAESGYTFNDDLDEGAHTIVVRALSYMVHDDINDVDKYMLYSQYSKSFIVTKLSAPKNIKVVDGVLTWGQVNNAIGYVLNINGTEVGDLETKIELSNTKFKYSFSEENAGSYYVTMASYAKGNNFISSNYSEPVKIIKLAPSQLSFVEGNITMVEATNDVYNDEEIAEIEYTYTVKDFNTNAISTFSSLQDIQSSVAENQKITVTVISKCDGYITSNVSNSITCTKLSKLSNLRISDGILTWDHLENASSYTLKFISEEAENIKNNGKTNSFDISTSGEDGYTSAGTWQIRVSASGNTLIGENQDSLYMNGDEVLYTRNSNSYINILSVVSSANFGVTDFTSFIYNPTFSNVSGRLFWSSVTFADGYNIRVTNVATGETTVHNMGMETSSTLSFLEAGNYNVSVYAYGDNVTNIMQRKVVSGGVDFKTSAELPICKVAQVKNVTVQNGILSWEKPSANYNTRGSTNIYVSYLALINGNFYSLTDFTNCVDSSEAMAENIYDAVSSTNYTFGSSFTSGSYKIKIYTVPLNYQPKDAYRYILSDPTEEKTFLKRETPTSVKIEEGVISWAFQAISPNTLESDYVFSDGRKFLAGSSSDYYELTIFHGTDVKFVRFQQSDFLTGEIPHFDFYNEYLRKNPTYNFESGSYSFAVRVLSIGQGDSYYLNSDYSISILTTILDATSILKVKDGVLIWDNVMGAESYELKIGSDDPRVITGNSFVMGEYYNPNSYNVTIRALGDGSNTLTSTYSDVFKVTKLATPEGLGLRNGQIVYQGVSNVNNYNIIINDSSIEDAGVETVFELGSNYPAGMYNIRVQAMGNSTSESGLAYVNSDVSEYLTTNSGSREIQKYDKVQNIQVKDGVLNWSSVSSGTGLASSYILNINEIEILVNGTFISLREKVTDINGVTYDLGGGTSYLVDVRARGTDNSFLSGDYTGSKKEIIKLPKVENISVENGVITWKNGKTNFYINSNLSVIITDAQGNETTDTIIELSGKNQYTYILPRFVENSDGTVTGYPDGKYNIKFCNMGDDSKYINSDDSIIITVEKLAVPTKIETQELLIEHFDNSISDEISLIFNNYDSNAKHYRLSIENKQDGTLNNKIVENCDERYFYATLTKKDFEKLGVSLTKVHEYTYKMSYQKDSIWNDVASEIVYVGTNDGVIEEVCLKMETCEKTATSYQVQIIDENETLVATVPVSMETIYKNYIAHFVKITSMQNAENYSFTVKAYNSDNNLLNTETAQIISNTEEGICVGFNFLTNEVKYVVLTITNNSTNESTSQNISVEDIFSYFSLLNVEMNVEAGDYVFTLQAVGESEDIGFLKAKVNSDVSEGKQITKPEKPTLIVIKENDAITGVEEYTGEIVWNALENVSGYFIEYKYMSFEDMNKLTTSEATYDWTDHDKFWTNIDWIRVDNKNKTSYNVGVAGYYLVRGISYLNDYGLTSELSDVVGVNYSSFYNPLDEDKGGSGTEISPYKIDSAYKFLRINYNPSAYYVLSADIDLTGINYNPLVKFDGSLDGAGHKIINMTNANRLANFGLFSDIGENGIVKNLCIYNKIDTLDDDGVVIGSTDVIISSGQNIGLVAVYNHGTISNCVVYGKIETNNVSNIIAGGITAVNYGTIEKCINYSNIAPQNDVVNVAVGGITGHNSGGMILFCGNEGNIKSHISGGIVGSNYSGKVIGCYNNANIVATAVVATDASMPAYAGGIVGYNSANEKEFETITMVYNFGNVSAISSSTAISAFSGGIVGFTESGKISYCYTVGGFSATCTSGSSSNLRTGAFAGNIGSFESGTDCSKIYYKIPAGNSSTNFIGAGDEKLYECATYESYMAYTIRDTWKYNGQTIFIVEEDYPVFIWINEVKNYFN